MARRHEGEDIVPVETRSRMMRAVRRSGTTPELVVRSLVRRVGAAYRVRNRDLPGSPDLANRTRRWAIFVHGCFWHGHRDCPRTKGGRGGRIPVRNHEFWAAKIRANRERDGRKEAALRERGFRVLVVWECELRDEPRVLDRLKEFLLGHGE